MTGRATHGHTRGRSTTPEFRSWVGMRQRCNDPKQDNYPRYGGRGVTVCDRWNESFECFLADMGSRPDGMTLDRVDNDGNYEPGNCRWSTYSEQRKNRRSFDPSTRPNCPSEHPYSGSNVTYTANGRKCKECDKLRSRASRRRAKEQGRAA